MWQEDASILQLGGHSIYGDQTYMDYTAKAWENPPPPLEPRRDRDPLIQWLGGKVRASVQDSHSFIYLSIYCTDICCARHQGAKAESPKLGCGVWGTEEMQSREVRGNHLLLRKEVACTNQPLSLTELKK